MTRNDLIEAIDRYGGNLERWPKALRDRATTLAAGDPEAARLLDEARHLDRVLGELIQPQPISAADVGHALARATGNRTGGTSIMRPTGWLAAMAATAVILCLAAGFAAGMATPYPSDDEAIAALMFGAPVIETGDLL